MAACLVAIVLSPPVIKPVLSAVNDGRTVEQVFLEFVVLSPAEGGWLPPLGGEVPVTPFVTRSGLVLNVPARRPAVRGPWPNACWNAPLPCTATPAPNVRLRDPGRLDRGFSVDGPWEMQDWPYYWFPNVLRELRQRQRR